MKSDMQRSSHSGPPLRSDLPELALLVICTLALLYSCSACSIVPKPKPPPEWVPKVYEIHVHEGKCTFVFDEFGEPYEEFSCGDQEKTKGLIAMPVDEFSKNEINYQKCEVWE